MKIVKDFSDCNALTHSGIFHADDVFAAAILDKIFEIDLLRTFKVPEEINSDVIVFDIGGGEFDHHQKEFNRTRKNGIKYASAGLIWEKFGYELIPDSVSDKKWVFKNIDEFLISAIDGHDNGQVNSKNNLYPEVNISGIIAGFNPSWDSNEDQDECFVKAVDFATIVLDNAINRSISTEKATALVENALAESTNNILILDRFMPWQNALFSSKLEKASNILYVIFPSNRGGYNIQAIPKIQGSFELKKPFPKEWRGENRETLVELTNVDSITFCHNSGFLVAVGTLTDAIDIAVMNILR